MSDFPYKTKSSPILLNNGDILISVLVFAAVGVTILTGLLYWGGALLAGIRATNAKEKSF